MDFKKEYSLHKNFNDACSDYRWRTRQNDDFKKAMKSKNIEYFNSFKNGILCITIFSTYTSTLNSGIPFIKDYRVGVSMMILLLLVKRGALTIQEA